MRPSSAPAEAVLGRYFPVLDHGFVALVDYMGTDSCIERAARLGRGTEQRTPTQTRGLLRFLRRHMHTTPSEMVELKFHCSMPIFVARQWLRHRMANVNESSARYSLMPMLFYTPEYERVQKRGTEHRPGRNGEPLAREDYRQALGHWQETREQAKHTYTWLSQNDVVRELARIDLPLSCYTQWYWKVDLHNLMHFLQLNVSVHAEWELREYARVLAGLMRRVTPLSYEAWIDYDVCGARFSRMELEALRSLLDLRTDGTFAVRDGASLSVEAMLKLGMSHREVTEFVDKLRPSQTPHFDADPARSLDATIFEQRMAVAVPESDGGAQLSQLSVPQPEPIL